MAQCTYKYYKKGKNLTIIKRFHMKTIEIFELRDIIIKNKRKMEE
jgi:hypothetical protein